MYQCYYSPDRRSFLTAECHKYGLNFISQLPGDHPFKFQVIRALQNLVKLIEGWNKVLFQILKTCGSGTLEMCFPHPVTLCVSAVANFFFFFKQAESSNHLFTRNWVANSQTELIFLRQQNRHIFCQYCRRFISHNILCSHPKAFMEEENAGSRGSARFRPAHLVTTVPDKPLWILLIPW